MFASLYRWWQHDRVRISPQVGQWLTLESGQRVIVADRLMVITGKELIHRDGQVGVRYRLLEISLAGGEPPLLPRPPLIMDNCKSTRRVSEDSIWMDCLSEDV